MKSNFKTKHLLFFLVAFAFSAFIFSCDPKAETIVDGAEEYVETDDNGIATCDASWFPHSQTPAPEEGKGSPFDTISTTNAIFHQWSWQKFLWLTKPQSNEMPLFMNQYILVDDNMVPLDDSDHALVLEYVTQAGSKGILIDNPNFNPSTPGDTIYYSLHINETLHQSAEAFRDQILGDPSQLNNSYTFPVGSSELKVAWAKASSIPSDKVNSYYTTEAFIKSTGETETMAFLGMHVTSVVENHPEFIWATFEHNDMTPSYNWAESTAEKDATVTSSDEKLFFAKGADASLADITWNKKKPVAPHNVFAIYTLGVPRVNGNDFMETSQSEPMNYNNIVSINDCVKNNLTDVWNNYYYNGSLWLNTDGMTAQEQADTLNSIGANLGSPVSGSLTRGSVAGSNITMETYAQTAKNPSSIHEMEVKHLINCMMCHTANAKIVLPDVDTPQGDDHHYSPLYISHLFRNHLSHASGVPKSEADASRINEFLHSIQHTPH